MRVHVVNLDRDCERLAHMRAELAGVGFARAAAVDGATLPDQPGLTRFERACLESHRRVWRELLAGGEAFACILEDDVRVSPDFARFVGDDAWIPEDADVVKLDTYLQPVMIADERPIAGGRALGRLQTRHESSAAYIVSRAGAARYLELTETPRLPVDYVLFPENPRRLGLVVYQLEPALAIQDHLIAADADRAGFASSIQKGKPLRGPAAAPSRSKMAREIRRFGEQLARAKDKTYLRLARGLRSKIVDMR